MEISLDEVTSTHAAVLVDFYADWCEPCKWVVPILDEVEKHFSGSLILHKVDIDKYSDVAKSFHIMSVPTLMLFIKGKEVWRMRGFDPAPVLIKTIQKLIA
jgi:thioredoxin 1